MGVFTFLSIQIEYYLSEVSTVPILAMDITQYASLVQKASYLRGFTINEIIHLERTIDEYLGRHFCKEQSTRSELMEWLLCTERITFNSKKDILKLYLEKHNPDFIKNNPSLFKDLDYIISKRNILAHQILDTSPIGMQKFKEDKISFVKITHKHETIEFNQEEFTRLQELINKLIIEFKKLLG